MIIFDTHIFIYAYVCVYTLKNAGLFEPKFGWNIWTNPNVGLKM